VKSSATQQGIFAEFCPYLLLSFSEIRSSRVGEVLMNLNQCHIYMFIVLSLSILIAHATKLWLYAQQVINHRIIES